VESTYHHGSLREALLAEGRRLLIEQGPDAVTLRELARRTGVSHAAPRRHFADRDALLAAIAARGFDELTEALRSAARRDDLRARLTAYAHAHVRFAVENGPLLTLMFSRRSGAGSSPDVEAAARFFALGGELLGEDPAGPVGPLPYLLAATLEGISSLVVAGRLPAAGVEGVVDEAVGMLLPKVDAQLRRGSPARSR
jgi:AcrR family transcriptional regulator